MSKTFFFFGGGGMLKTVYLWFHNRVFYVSVPSSVYQINIAMTSCRLDWKTHFIRFFHRCEYSVFHCLYRTIGGESAFIIITFFFFIYMNRVSEKICKRNICENKSL